MASPHKKMKAEILRRKVRELLAARKSLAQIVKETGKSVTHIRRIVEQELADAG